MLDQLRKASDGDREAKEWVKERRKPGNLLRKASKKILAFSLAGVGAPAAAGAAKRAPRPREARSIAELHRAIDARFDAVAGAVGSLEARLDQSVARVEDGGAAAAAGAAEEAAASPGLFSSLFGGGAAAAPEAATTAADGDAHGGRRKSDQPRTKRRPSLIKAAAWAAGGGAAEEAPAAEEEAPSGSASKRGGYSTRRGRMTWSVSLCDRLRA